MIKLGSSDITLKVGSNDVSAAYLGNTLVYSGGTPTHDYSQDYLTFTALENGTFKFSGNTVSYSLNSGETWTNLSSNKNSPTVNQGDKILWKAALTPSSSKGIGRFSSTGQFAVEGNAMSLVNGDNFIGATTISNYQFKNLFSGCTSVISAENFILPATTLYGQCYDTMFGGCTSLTSAPALPATTLAYSCYSGMFRGCTSLRTAPELPATSAADNFCYQSMFNGCTNLNYIKCLATDISGISTTENWVRGVAASGTFVKDANMTGWPTGANGIPTNWTVVDNV